IPLMYREEGLDDLVVDHFGLRGRARPDMRSWRRIVNTIKNPKHGSVEVAVVGKYMNLQDSYRSIYDALVHGGIKNNCRVDVRKVHAEAVEKQGAASLLKGADAILVPWGFGKRGIDGKIAAIRYAREKKIPFLGICLGMQCSVVEFAKDVAGLEGASSTEFEPRTPHPVISLMDEQRSVVNKGGTMRLGAYPCVLKGKTKAFAAYGKREISERHRHRWEFNPEYRKQLESLGLIVSGTSPDEKLVEMVELKDHPWFVACQFHPELKSRPWCPHPLFAGLIGSALKRKR
ncbi:MAG: CTP synthase, partial [bacterium]